MGKLAEAHYEIGRDIRWHARRISDRIEVNGRIERWHRSDRYRDIVVSSEEQADIELLLDRVRSAGILSRGNVTIDVRVQNGSGRIHPARFEVAIWPYVPKAD